MIYQASRKTRIIAAVAATLAFTGTLVAYAHADNEPPETRKFRIISTPEDCTDYHAGQIIEIVVSPSAPDRMVVDLGIDNKDIVIEAVDPQA